MRAAWLVACLAGCQADLVRDPPTATPATPQVVKTPPAPIAKTPIEMLATASFSEVLQAKRQLLRDRAGSIPQLVAMVDRDERVVLEHTADLIYPGAKKFYGHGWIVNYDLDALADRAGWVLEELTFHDFGFSDGVNGEFPFDRTKDPDRLAHLRAKVHAWWDAQHGSWSCYTALVDAMRGPNPRFVYAWLFEPDGAPCDGLTAARFRSDVLPLVKSHARDRKHPTHDYAVEFLTDVDARVEALVKVPLDVVVARMKATTATTTVADLESSLGTRLRDIGSGIHIFVYDVDGDEFRVGSSDGTTVMYIRHVHAGTETVLYGPK